jgi:hypothetical protein
MTATTAEEARYVLNYAREQQAKLIPAPRRHRGGAAGHATGFGEFSPGLCARPTERRELHMAEDASAVLGAPQVAGTLVNPKGMTKKMTASVTTTIGGATRLRALI